MTKLLSLFTATVLTICTLTTRGQPTQAGIIDFYGTVQNEYLLRKCLPFKEGDTLHFLTDSGYPIIKKQMIDCLLLQENIRQADIALVCCDEKEGKWIVFVGVDTKPTSIPKRNKTSDISLPFEITATCDSLMNIIPVAIEKGEATEDYASGHSLMTYKPARRLQEKFITYASDHLILLKDVLQHSMYTEQRAIAATVMAYHPDKTLVTADLLAAVTDTDEGVRNNAVRAIGILSDYAQNHPDLNINIPANPFIELIHSISWTDRNKSSFVLLNLTNNRDQKLLNQLKQQALKPIANMAQWKSSSHSMPGFILLGRIAGWPEEKIMEGLNGDRKQMVEEMLAEMNN